MDQKITDNHKSDNTENSVSSSYSVSAKVRAFIAGFAPAAIFRYTLATSVIIALAAGVIWHTSTDIKHVSINKVDTATVVLTGSDNLGGIGPGEYKGVSYSLTNNSSAPAYVFVRIEETTGLYEVVGSDSNSPDGWVEVTTAENTGELIFAYGTSGAMTPVPIGETVSLEGRLHCLASAEVYSGLSGDDMDIEVEGCLVYGSPAGEYSTSAGSLWQAYQNNK